MFRESNFFAFQPPDIDGYRAHIEPMLNELQERFSTISTVDVIEQAKDCRAQLWGYASDGVLRAIAATHVQTTAKGRVLSVFACIGFDELPVIQAAHSKLEEWARSVGCCAIEIVGRPGWERALDGYRRTAVVLEKQLERAH